MQWDILGKEQHLTDATENFYFQGKYYLGYICAYAWPLLLHYNAGGASGGGAGDTLWQESCTLCKAICQQ